MKRSIVFLLAAMWTLFVTGCGNNQTSLTVATEHQTTAYSTSVPDNATTQTTIKTTDPLTTTTSAIRTYDFFSDDNRVGAYYSYLAKYEFSEIFDMTNEYIEQNNPIADDLVFEVQSIVESLVYDIKKCVIKYDDGEQKYSVFYSGIEKIGGTINIVPYTCGTYENHIVGFISPKWLWLKSIEIELGPDDYIWESWDRSVLNRVELSGSIMEFARTGFAGEEIEMIIDSREPILRFFNAEKTKQIDHNFTENEIKAIQTIHRISLGYKALYQLQEKWTG
jgi:hypothetical protein